MAAGGEGGAVQDEVGGVIRCSVTQFAGGIAGGCAVHPAVHNNIQEWKTTSVYYCEREWKRKMGEAWE